MHCLRYLLQFLTVLLVAYYVTDKKLDATDLVTVAGVSTLGFYLVDQITNSYRLESMTDLNVYDTTVNYVDEYNKIKFKEPSGSDKSLADGYTEAVEFAKKHNLKMRSFGGYPTITDAMPINIFNETDRNSSLSKFIEQTEKMFKNPDSTKDQLNNTITILTTAGYVRTVYLVTKQDPPPSGYPIMSNLLVEKNPEYEWFNNYIISLSNYVTKMYPPPPDPITPITPPIDQNKMSGTTITIIVILALVGIGGLIYFKKK